MEKIDNLDRQILEIISQNARIPFKDVAAECGVSRAAIHQRVQRLIDLWRYCWLRLSCKSQVPWIQNLHLRRNQAGKGLHV